VSALATRRNITLVGFLNDEVPKGQLIAGAPVLGPFSSWQALSDDIQFLAPLHKVKAMPTRVNIVETLGIPEHRWATIIDPMSAVALDVEIGRGCFVGPFASVGPGARIGAHTVVRAGANVSHDCAIGNFVFVGTNAVVCGFAAVHDGAYIAPAATIGDHRQVGKFAVVGMGSVVTHDVPDFVMVAGSPARVR
jgi:acetyltransferase EpsM